MLAHEVDVDKAVYETFKVAETKRGDNDTFSNYSPIYIAPTGNTLDTVGLYTKKGHNIESALVVGSQGSFAYELALKGVKKIDCFDKNILQYLFYSLIEATIRNVNFKDFINNFTSKRIAYSVQEFHHILSDWIFFEVLDEIGGPEAEYWAKIYRSGKIHKLLDSNLFRTYYPFYIEFLKDISSVYNRDSYNNLKSILNHNEVEITYHICDISEIHREFADQKYDLIMFDNILQYYKDIPTLDNIRTINCYAKEKWAKMLTDNGQIQIGYGFEIACDAARNMLNNDEVKKPTNFEEMAMRFGIEKEKEEGFISNIIKTYRVSDDSPYSIDYIRAVEENDGHMDSKNAILTYKPKQEQKLKVNF